MEISTFQKVFCLVCGKETIHKWIMEGRKKFYRCNICGVRTLRDGDSSGVNKEI